MLKLDSPIGDLGRLAKAMSKRLKKLGLETCEDLLFYFPFRYEDLSVLKPIAELELGTVASLRGRIEVIKNFRSPVKRMMVTEAVISDPSGQIKAIWFNQPYLTKVLKQGLEVFLAGKIESPYYTKQVTNPSYEMAGTGAPTHTGRIVPIYSLTSDLSQKQLRAVAKTVIPLSYEVKDWLPERILSKYELPAIGPALRSIHFPASMVEAEKARERLKFDEVFLIQLQLHQLRHFAKVEKAPEIKFQEAETKAFVAGLPFPLTDDQRKSAWQILQDMGSGRPMNRLLQGEVGSGKTVTGAIAVYNTALNGFQSLLMAPTEILAKQHFLTAQKFLPSLKVCLLTHSEQVVSDSGKITRAKLLNRIRLADVDLVIGTHALIQEDVSCGKLGLAIVDEQHRFGVQQRKILTQKNNLGLTPHLLSMTATPIPRTLALTWYSDLDLSEIRQLPKGRKAIVTQVVAENQRARTYELVREQIAAGRQAYVICPLIDHSDKLGVKAVTVEKTALEKVFPEFKIGLLHGRLKSADKEDVMAKFKAGEYQVLVATSVIEVGVDVPNASVMMIEGAERFGLSQLHQIRGRVGRGEHQSYCYLFPSETAPTTLARLAALATCQDGFELAQKDLELRGPGELYGTRQSGLPELKLTEFDDYVTIKKAQSEAKELIDADPGLDSVPFLKDKISSALSKVHLE